MTSEISWGFDEPQHDSGQRHLSGAGIGCVALVNQDLFISYNKTFHKVPEVSVFSSVTSEHDKVAVAVVDRNTNGFVCRVTTFGRDGNKICADSFINWTAYTKK